MGKHAPQNRCKDTEIVYNVQQRSFRELSEMTGGHPETSSFSLCLCRLKVWCLKVRMPAVWRDAGIRANSEKRCLSG